MKQGKANAGLLKTLAKGAAGLAAVSVAAGVIDNATLDPQKRASLSLYERMGKRACDTAISLVALPVVGLITGACALAIKYEDKGPVFYNAPRVGKDGKEFTMYKLRSMRVNAPDLVMEDGSTYNGADDPRMTKVGAFMRKTSLDEFPQFLNVLKGDMSVIGPRPDLKRETELYRGEEGLKLTVRPGVTGYAAVYGRNSLPWHDRLALDVYYVKNLSLALDAQVFLRTFSTVLKQEGIYVEEDAEDKKESPAPAAAAVTGENATPAVAKAAEESLEPAVAEAAEENLGHAEAEATE